MIFDELKIKFENKSLMVKLQLIESENKLERSRSRVAFLMAGLLLTLMLIGIGFRIWQRRNTELLRKITEQKALSLEQENRLKQDEIENIQLKMQLQEELTKRYQLDSQIREQELVFQSLKQVQLSKINQSVREKFSPFKHKLSRKKDQELFEQTMEEVGRDASRDPLAEFEQIFTQMHNGFYEKLLETNNNLSRSELQICALLRLNLPSKEISNLLHITMASVDQKRHQIRKKLQVEGNQSLIGFLINL